MEDINSTSWIITFIVSLVSLVIAVLELPFIISKWHKSLLQLQQKLKRKLSKYNQKEKQIIVTSIMGICFVVVFSYLAYAQFDNSIPTLLYMQTLPASSIPNGFSGLMWFGVFSGIICSIIGFFLLKVNGKELRIVFSPKTFD